MNGKAGLRGQFQLALSQTRQPYDSLMGLAPIFDFFDDMGFAPVSGSINQSTLKTKDGTYTMTHGIAVDSETRAFVRLEGTNKAFPGLRISGNATKSSFEIGPLNKGEKAITAGTYNHADTVRNKLATNLRLFPDLKPLVKTEHRTAIEDIPASRRIMPATSTPKQVLSSKQPVGVLGRAQADRKKAAAEKTAPPPADKPAEPGKS